jgi:hypothetical protein
MKTPDRERESDQIAIMNLKSFWERHKPRRWAKAPRPFQPLTPQESVAILGDTIQWLIDESRATILMSEGPSKERRQAELLARDKSTARDFQRLMRQG